MGSGDFGGGHKGKFDREHETTTSKKKLSQEAVDKIIYDIMSSDQGLASLATSENASGGFGSSTKSLMAQDLTAKIAGEIGKLTAETVERRDKGSRSHEFTESAKSVICTHLAHHGYISLIDYTRGFYYYDRVLHPRTYAGYFAWAQFVPALLTRFPLLCKILTPIVRSRYDMILGRKKFTFLGGLTIYLGEPICFALGYLYQAKRVIYG
jgi:hypothetical protein